MQTSKEHDNCEALKSLRTGNEASKWESKYILKEETRTQGTKKQRKASKPSKRIKKQASSSPNSSLAFVAKSTKLNGSTPQLWLIN